MSAHLATVDQLSDYPRVGSLTPRGWSQESGAIRTAESDMLRDYLDVPASRFHLHSDDECGPILRLAVEELSSILDAFRDRIPQQTAKLIRNRIEVLLDSAEWEMEDELPNPESFRRMLSFLASNKNLRSPSIFLNRYGLFTASWRPESRKLTSIVFQSDDMVNWLVFSPREDDDQDIVENAGRAPLETVLREIKKTGATRWMRRPSFFDRLFGNG